MRGDRDRLAGLADRRAGAAREAAAAADRSDRAGFLRAINATFRIGEEFDRVAAGAGLKACDSSTRPPPQGGRTSTGIRFPLPKTPGFRFTRPTESPETFVTGSGLDTLNAIFVRRITRQELELGELERGFARSARAGSAVRVLDVRRERHSGIDMVRFDNAIRLERPVRSSYFLFPAAGSSFQIECQSTAEKRRQLLRGCSEVIDGIKRR